MALDNARKFLARVLPWTADGSTYANMHFAVQKPDRDKPIFMGNASRTLNEFMKGLEYRAKDVKSLGLYVCMSAQANAEKMTSPNGRTWLKALRSSDAAVQLRSLYLDIDVKEGAYGSTTEAITALGKFCTDTNLPPPTCAVRTGGGGIHAHWVSENLTPDMWRVLAFALAEATKRHGLICDSQCTVDAARILRIPDTLDRRFSPAAEIKLLFMRDTDIPLLDLQKALEPYMGTAPAAQPTGFGALPAAFAGIVDTLAAGIETATPTPKLDTINCPFLKDTLADGGATLTNPLWNLTTLLATFTDDPRPDAHRLACGHPGYTVGSTDELYDRKITEKVTKNLGWPRCSTISASGATQCQGCPNFQQGKSPLNFAVVPPGAMAGGQKAPRAVKSAFDLLPEHYTHGKDGSISLTKVDDMGNADNAVLFPYPMLDMCLHEVNGDWRMAFTVGCVIGDQLIELKGSELSSVDKLRTFLFSKGLSLQDHQTNEFRKFLMAWMSKLREARDMIVESRDFGWTETRDKQIMGFTYAGTTFFPGGKGRALMANEGVAEMYTPCGSLSPWIKLSNVITEQERPDLNCILAGAFAAPLMRFTGDPGGVLSTFSTESGIGKSTALKVGQAVWGAPEARKELTDTINNVVGQLSAIKNLPLYWDEIKNAAQTETFVSFIFQLAGGKGKGRMKSDASLRKIETWSSMLISCSNASIVDAVLGKDATSPAGLYRMLEFEVTRGTKGQLDGTDVALQLNALSNNNGQAGLRYAEYLGGNFALVANRIEDNMRMVRRAIAAKSDERFWVSTSAALITGAEIANELGLTQINVPAMRQHLYKAIDTMRRVIGRNIVNYGSASDMVDLLSTYFSSRRARNTMETERVHMGVGRPGKAVVLSDMTKLDELTVHVGREDHLIRWSRADFSEWMVKTNRTNKNEIIKSLINNYHATEIVGRLGGGTDRRTGNMRLLQIDAANPVFANGLTEVIK